MFQYNPSTQNNAGEIMARNQMIAAQAMAQARERAAMINVQSMAQMGQNIGDAIASIGGVVADQKASAAKDKAYMQFFSKHGDDLGIDANYLEELKTMSRKDRLASFDLLTGASGQRLGSLEYLKQQASSFGRRGDGTGAGGGGGGQPGGGWTVY